MTFSHVKNFLECVRTRQRPNGDVLIGHRSAQASHLGNIAYVQKRRLDFDPEREEIQNDAEAAQLLGRKYREGHWAIPRMG